jgi:FG-GAP repeat
MCVSVAALACATVLGVVAVQAAAESLTADPFLQQGAKLSSSELTEQAEQGSSVALSADGNTALVGGWFYKGGEGATWVYTRSGSTWTQQAKLVGGEASKDAQQGFSVALSADGNTVLIGGPENEETGVFPGAAWVFTRSGSVWTQQQKLVGSGGSTPSAQGRAVALSANGDTALIGGDEDSTGVGAAWVFTRSGSVWTQQGAKLVGAHTGSLVQEGLSVALAGDGNTALIGGPRAEGEKGEKEAGAAWVFTRSGSIWSEKERLPSGKGAGEDTAQGQSVALAADGSTALVGGPGYDKALTLGAAWVYQLEGGKWIQQGEKLLGEDASTEPEQGHSVSLSEDGNTALVGGYHDDTSVGAAWAFARSGSTWDEQEKLVGTGSIGGFPTQGSSVALSGDGLTALVGGTGDNGGVGAAWVFARAAPEGKQPEGKTEQKTETPPSNPNGSNASTNTGAGGTSTGKAMADLVPTAAEREERLASAFGLPSNHACYSRRVFKIHIQQPHGYPRVVSAEVFLGKKRERKLNGRGLTDEVVLAGLPHGTFTIKIVARTVAGTTLTGSRTYHTCRSKPIRTHRPPRL